MAMRNGRFKSARTIITGRTSTFFRILNSGEFDNTNQNKNAFSVTFGAGANDNVVVLPTFSVDVLVQGDVVIAPAIAMAPVQGIYDALPNAEFKSGRFKTKDPMDATAGVPLVVPGGGNARAIYRIFNSGPVPLQMITRNPNGMGQADFGPTIAEDESYDFVTPQNKILLVKGTMAATNHIEGIYDFIAMA